MVVLGWIVGMVALFTGSQIESAAFHQPATPAGIYSHPYYLKGTWRYITDQQAVANNFADIARPFGGLLFVIGGVWAATVEALAARRQLGTRPPTDWGDV
jgi:hypothetical protein